MRAFCHQLNGMGLRGERRLLGRPPSLLPPCERLDWSLLLLWLLLRLRPPLRRRLRWPCFFGVSVAFDMVSLVSW